MAGLLDKQFDTSGMDDPSSGLLSKKPKGALNLQALIGQSISDYLSINGSGSGSPMRDVGSDGVRQGGFSGAGGIEAKIPVDKIIEDVILRLQAGGYAYGGKVELPQKYQDDGAPAEISYGDKVTTNLGLGFTRGDVSGDLNYNPASNDYKLGYSNGGFSGNVGYNPQTDDRAIFAKYKMNF